MNWIMNKARGWIYRHGYRPKPGSIFYSPSTDLILATREAIAELRLARVEPMAWPDDPVPSRRPPGPGMRGRRGGPGVPPN